jgi:phage terminase large subunit-like protein
MSDLPETVTIKLHYGTDPIGFYWAGSAEKRSEVLGVKRNEPATFQAVYQGRPGRRIGTIFLADDFTFYTPPPDLESGCLAPGARELLAKGQAVFQAWDTAFSTSEQSAFSVCVTGMFVPCDRYHRNESSFLSGTCEHHFDVVILDVFRRKMDWGDLPNEVKRQYFKWQPQMVIIEKRASGISLVQTLPSAGIPVLGIEVGAASKGERAINRVDARSAGSVQGWCRQHRVSFPEEASWLDVFLAELKDFSGDGGGASDQVDAFVHLVTHAIKLGSTTMMLPTGFDGQPIMTQPAPAAEEVEQGVGFFLQVLGLPGIEDLDDPYAGMCGRCRNYEDGYCVFQRRAVISMDSCLEYSEPEAPAQSNGRYQTSF